MKREITTQVRRRLGDEHRGETDWPRVDALSDREIAAAVADDVDAAPLLDEEFWAHAEMVIPAGRKERITLRLDEEVLDHFRGLGRGYQTRINTVLRAYVRQQQKSGRNRAG